MTVYQVEFSEDWIRGRWGFTDRVFSDLRGKEADPSLARSAWVVNHPGSPSDLGELLSEMLNIQANDFQRFGAIFQITPLSDPGEDPAFASGPPSASGTPSASGPPSASGAPSASSPRPSRPQSTDPQYQAPWERPAHRTRRSH